MARQYGVTPAVLFHVAWARVLGQCSNRDDVVFGTVLTGRLQGTAGAERALGMFMNTLPLRLPSSDVDVATAVRQMYARLGALLMHEQASLALAQRCSGVAAPLPLFTALLNYRHGHEDQAAPGSSQPGWDGVRILKGNERTNYPLVLSVNDHGHRFSLSIQAATGINAERVAGYAATAIAHLVAALRDQPQCKLSGIDILPAAERQHLLHDLNDTAAPMAGDLRIHELFERRARQQPAALALVFGAQELT
jgi:non-ribosomal peptide synthetase component F